MYNDLYADSNARQEQRILNLRSQRTRCPRLKSRQTADLTLRTHSINKA